MGNMIPPWKDLTDSTSMPVEEGDETQVESDSRKLHKDTPKKAAAGPDVTALKEFCAQTSKLGVSGLLEQFLKIKIETQHIGNIPKTAFDAHAEKNRYKDVYCIDATRVKLTFPEGGDDYINANWINGADGNKKFICTQGPKPNTIDDFWRLVWQEKCRSIVMLCNEIECGYKKCERYWPDAAAGTMTFASKLSVRFINTEYLEKQLTLTRLELTLGESRLQVEHIQWRDWPDRGVPETSLSVFSLLDRVNKLTPSVVHCSAGIGRTGTVVGIDILYQKLEKGIQVTAEDVVRQLRNARHGSVQTDVQYIYMHRILMAAAENKKAVTSADIEKFVTDYDAHAHRAKGAKP